MNTLPIIVTSRSAISTAQECLRKRYFAYEAENGSGVTHGWERRALSLPLTTGIHTHKGLEALLLGQPVDDAVAAALATYHETVTARGMDSEVADDVAYVINEQAALIEALVRGWNRVRLPLLLEEYEVVSVESEESVALSPDVTLQTRSDALLKRRSDGRLFVFNPKTVSDAGDRWYKGWEVDMQFMTEVLAVEARVGERLGGVIIEGLVKGKRMPEKDKQGQVLRYRQATPLIYGYKLDSNLPIQKADFTWEYTRAKGWHRFTAWDDADLAERAGAHGRTCLSYWVDWLPIETVESSFAVVPPIMRQQQAIESKARQIVALERRIRAGREAVAAATTDEERLVLLDEHFLQNERACHWPTMCHLFDACWTDGVGSAMGESGLFIPRKANHPSIEENS